MSGGMRLRSPCPGIDPGAARRRLPLRPLVIALLLLAAMVSCVTPPPDYLGTPTVSRGALFEYPYFDAQPEGIAVTDLGRIFVSFPRWEDLPGMGVAEVLPGGELRPYPDGGWNDPTKPPAARLVTPQSLTFDGHGSLWILDAASPGFAGPVAGGPKLLQVDLHENRIIRVFRFGKDAAPAGAYLADVAIHPSGKSAFISDAGLGAILVVDLKTGAMRRLLSGDPSVRADPKFQPVVAERRWRPGRLPMNNVDALAVDPTGKYLYYRPLASSRLYRIETRLLLAGGIPEEELRRGVAKVAEVGFVDGISFDSYGNLYLSNIGNNAIDILVEGKPQMLFRDPRIRWPARLAVGPDNYIYFTASQFDLSPRFNEGEDRRELPYRLFKFWLAPFQYRPPA